MSDTHTDARLLRVRCELEHAVAEFQRMLQANEVHMRLGPQTAPPYTDAQLKEASQAIAWSAPDPHNFV